jgi:tRNA A-37 threonylcarbamoyl transferase component Bud32
MQSPAPTSTDDTSRNELPYPIAKRYQRWRYAHEDADRCSFGLNLGEEVIKFLLVVALADSASKRVGAKELKTWLRVFQPTGFGKFTIKLKTVTQAIAERGKPFVRELPGLVGDVAWNQALSALIDERNHSAHDGAARGSDAKKAPADALEPHVHRVMEGIQFLRRYRLGYLTGLRVTGSGRFFYRWIEARGQDERGKPVELDSPHAHIVDWPMLVDPESNEALYLEPYFHRGLMAGSQEKQLLWIQGIEGDPKQMKYSHAMTSTSIVSNLADPETPTESGLTVDDYEREPAKWPGIRPFANDPSAIVARPIPIEHASFGDRFEWRCKIGEGGMSEIWEVYDTRLSRICAVKVLRDDLLQSESSRERFEREARLLGQLDDPKIVRIHGLDAKKNGTPYLIMEKIDGENLDEWVRRAGPPPVQEGVRIFAEAMAALAVAHDAGVVHRDVKPSNFMRASSGVRLIDFGVAFIPDSRDATRNLDRIYTPGYAAPELLYREPTRASDIFAAGTLLFYLLSGRLPEPHDEPLDRAVPQVPPAVAAVYARATAAAATQRFASARELGEAALAALGVVASAPVVASPMTASPMTASPVTASPAVASPVAASPIAASPAAAAPVVPTQRTVAPTPGAPWASPARPRPPEAGLTSRGPAQAQVARRTADGTLVVAPASGKVASAHGARAVVVVEAKTAEWFESVACQWSSIATGRGSSPGGARGGPRRASPSKSGRRP